MAGKAYGFSVSPGRVPPGVIEPVTDSAPEVAAPAPGYGCKDTGL